MAWTQKNFIDLADLFIAYRKAKVDTFYENDHITSQKFADFEEKLSANLEGLLARLNANNADWTTDLRILGCFSYIPKSLEFEENSSPEKMAAGFVNSNPDMDWKQRCALNKPKAEFRLIGDHTVEYHVISALWILKVGHLYDNLLGDCAYGYRLRRKKVIVNNDAGISVRSLGNFKHYSHGYIQWRQRGLRAMHDALSNDTPIVAITADLKKFFHEVSPDYLVNETFIEKYHLNLSEDQLTFTQQLIESIHTWAKSTPYHAEEPKRGLPVGLTASRIIANVLLLEFDNFVQLELSPLYYGRYVDDVFLVLNNHRKMESSKDVWDYLIKRSGGLLSGRIDEDNRGQERSYWLTLAYSPISQLRFGGAKQKVFALEGTSGKSLLGSIETTVQEQFSDWRLLPDLPDEEDALAHSFISAVRDSDEVADNLRKAEGISIQRFALAMRLRTFEAIQRDLRPDQWADKRNAFYQLALDHILTAPGLFAYSSYIHRLVGLAVSCGDWEHVLKVVLRIGEIFDLLEDTTTFKRQELQKCRTYFARACFESLVQSLGLENKRSGLRKAHLAAIEKLADLKTLASDSREFMDSEIFTAGDVKSVITIARKLYEADLGRRAFRELWIEEADQHQSTPTEEIGIELPADVYDALHGADVREFLKKTSLWDSPNLPRAAAFPTRPFSPAEISLLDQDCLYDLKLFGRWVSAFRGAAFVEDGDDGEKVVIQNGDGGERKVVVVPNRSDPNAVHIALPCLLTQHESWVASIDYSHDPDSTRYLRINRLINEVLKAEPRVRYLVFPELALPRRWFNRISHKLLKSGISLIAGLEYFHWDLRGAAPASPRRRPYVSNEVRASLVTDALGYPTQLIYVQEKLRPAPQEERDLTKIAGKTLKPRKPNNDLIPVIQHGGLYFGILICSEFSNLSLRASFRGRVDVLFVPEWNKDTNSFSALVEASASDLHCYIVQVNNREYGDCRVRAPYAEDYRRDVARVKGGDMDYFVIARIDVHNLRAFQSYSRSPERGTYKPVPDGFAIEESRRVRPA